MEETGIKRKQWYIGEVGKEAATEILRNCERDNVFVVHKSPSTNDYIVSVRFPPVEGIQESLIDNFTIRRNDDEKYEITGQSDVYDSILDAIDAYTTNRNLSPALENKLSPQASISEPPEYDQANRLLQPDIAPLPKISHVRTEKPKQIEPDHTPSSFVDHEQNMDDDHYTRSTNQPDNRNYPIRWRHQDRGCWPMSTDCFCYHWHDCWRFDSWCCGRNGCLCCLVLVLMWCVAWPVAVVQCCRLIHYWVFEMDWYDDD